MRLRTILAALSLGTAACQTIQPPAVTVSLAITNVTVIDPSTRQVVPSQSVYLNKGKIVAVLPSSARQRFIGAKTIDGSGRFLIPGLTDMHVHLFLAEQGAEPSLNLLLANGVTSIREMSSDCWAAAGSKKGCVSAYKDVQAKIQSGEMAGPEILGLTSTMVMGPSRLKLPATAPAFITPRTAEEASALVQYLRGRGVDMIKTHDSIPFNAFQTLMEEANEARIAVGGHIPFRAGSLGAARLGYRSIEHARDLLYDCSRYGPEFRSKEAAVAAGVPGSERPANAERLTRTVTEYDEGLCKGMLAELAKTDTYYVPTHVTREAEARAADATYRALPARRYISAVRNANWERDLLETAALPFDERNALSDFFNHGLTVTGLAHRVGIPVMVGTDTNDTMIVPGFSLHRELQLLVEAGLSPMEALRAATATPASYFERQDLGGIKSGMEADLVLLGSDPLQNIANTTAILAVISNGRLWDRSELDKLLAQIQQMGNAPSAN